MILTTLVALAAFAGGDTLYCPSTLEEVKKPATSMLYGGTVYSTCCAGCDKPFLNDPKGSIAKAQKEKKTIGIFAFNPVSGNRIESKKAKASSDYKSVRYFFMTADEKKAFDAEPAKYVLDVTSEANYCPVMNHETTPGKADAYSDYNGVRYYLCCGGCIAAFRKEPAKYVGNASKAVKPLAVAKIK